MTPDPVTLDAEVEDHSIRLANQAEEIDELRDGIGALAGRVAKLEQHNGELRWHAEVTNERLTRLETQEKADQSVLIKAVRQAILVVGLTEIIRDLGWEDVEFVDSIGEEAWRDICTVLYERYGHIVVDGKPLWIGSPKLPSPETKALIAESLRRQEP